MKPLYHSPYEAYPFLSDDSDDLRCDFELLTDEMASRVGLLRALCREKSLYLELLWICELIYHINPTLRTRLTVTQEETDRLAAATDRLRTLCAGRCERFVVPQGCEAACAAHLLRVQAKCLVRLLYRYTQQGHPVPDRLLDLANLLSGYFFFLALFLNMAAGIGEITYESRNYPARPKAEE